MRMCTRHATSPRSRLRAAVRWWSAVPRRTRGARLPGSAGQGGGFARQKLIPSNVEACRWEFLDKSSVLRVEKMHDFYFQSESYILKYGFLHGATFLDMSAALSTS